MQNIQKKQIQRQKVRVGWEEGKPILSIAFQTGVMNVFWN
jgi:hypothetical protein